MRRLLRDAMPLRRGEWGLALHIESHKGGDTRRYLLDFGFTPEVYAANLEFLKIDVGDESGGRLQVANSPAIGESPRR